MPNARGKRIAQQIVSIFETGTAEGDYGAVAVLSDGAGISYGLHQVTDGGGNLAEVMRRYVAREGLLANEVAPHVAWIEGHGSRDEDPEALTTSCMELMDALQRAGRDDPTMQDVQDNVFDERYWQPAADQCEAMGLRRPLSWALVYDSCIQSGPDGVGKIRKMFPQSPPSNGGTEQGWTTAYVRARYSWLASYPNERVRITKARMEAFQRLIDVDNWGLILPITVNGITIPKPEPRV
jgi:chitosanase